MRDLAGITIRFSLEDSNAVCKQMFELHLAVDCRTYNNDVGYVHVRSNVLKGLFLKLDSYYYQDNVSPRLTVLGSIESDALVDYFSENYSDMRYYLGSKIYKADLREYLTQEECNQYKTIIFSWFPDFIFTSSTYTAGSFNSHNPSVELQIISLITLFLDRYERKHFGQSRRDSQENSSGHC